ncbi:hypothetical protein ACFWA9_04870 [Kitasatospora sp. NPDC059973]|uniref:hypothetical protein n=1 Tax=Kitasatospora sp. NPDC059973 TaxID=3347020 RepID=UPI0036A684BB
MPITLSVTPTGTEHDAAQGNHPVGPLLHRGGLPAAKLRATALERDRRPTAAVLHKAVAHVNVAALDAQPVAGLDQSA